MSDESRISRRSFVQKCLVAGSAIALVPEFVADSSPDKALSGKMEEALELLSRFGPEYRGGLANHAPMVADALISMGREEAVLPWVERYSRQLDEHPASTRKISIGEWRSALGDFSRATDWVNFFNSQLSENPWREVLAQWVPLLAPGLAAAAAHGLLRTAHITRRLSQKETPSRINELAEGLGYWAARYVTLPESANKPVAKMKPSEAIRLVKLLPEDQRRSGLITDRFEALSRFTPFADSIQLIDDSMQPSELLSDLTRTFAQIYLMNPRRYLIAFVHAVTGPSSIRILLPYLPAEGVRDMLRYGWQLAAAIYSANAEKTFDGVSEQSYPDADDLIDRAISAQDEHAIKFTEACLREHRLNPHPIYLIAARNACDQLRG